MRYDFSKLSGLDFEELVHDLLQVEWGRRLELFRVGRDGGVDLRGLEGADRLVVQCKNYQGSTFAALRAKIRDEELPKVRQLAPMRYVLVTSLELTVRQKDELVALLHPYARTAADVIGGSEIVQMLERHPDVVKRHYKLWLTSVAVLERVLHAAEHEQTRAHVERVTGKLPLFVQTDAYLRAMEALNQHRVAIISGAPGIGKSTLADMLLYAHVADGYAPAVIRSGLAEGRRLASSGGPTIFYFDDFLGQTFLGDRPDFLGRREDADLVEFIEWVRAHTSYRFVLTTREHVLAEALQRSEKLRHAGVADERCIITLTDFKRSQRARILYNHLFFSDLPEAYKREMLRNDFFLEVVDCDRFNPRIVEWLSSERRLRSVPAANYQQHVRTLMNNPHDIWRHAYMHELSQAARDVLVALYSLSYVVYVDDLEKAFDGLHTRSIRRANQRSAPGAYKAAMKELDGSFIEVTDGQVDFINPSVRDFVSTVLQDDPEVVLDVVDSAVKFNQLSEIWSGASPSGPFPTAFDRLKAQAYRLAEAFERVLDVPNLRWFSSKEGQIGRYVDDSMPTRAVCLLDVQHELPAARSVALRAINIVARDVARHALSIHEVGFLLEEAWKARARGDWADVNPLVEAVSGELDHACGNDWLTLLNLRKALEGQLEEAVPGLTVALGSEPNFFLAPARAGRIQAPWLIGADRWPTNSG